MVFFAVFTSLLFEVIINLLIGALPLALAKYVKIPILGKLVDKLLTFDKGQILHGLNRFSCFLPQCFCNFDGMVPLLLCLSTVSGRPSH